MNRGLGAFLVAALTFTLLSSMAYAAPVDDVRAQLSQVFSLVVRVERSGGDVSGLVTKLDQAASFLNAGDVNSLGRASALINEVKVSVGSVSNLGTQASTIKYLWVGWSLFILGVWGLLIYLYGSRVFWALWLRFKRDWRVEAT
jgi:hypothetical protein